MCTRNADSDQWLSAPAASVSVGAQEHGSTPPREVEGQDAHFDAFGPLLLEDGRWAPVVIKHWPGIATVEPGLAGAVRVRGVIASRLATFETWRAAGIPALLDTTPAENQAELRAACSEHLGFRGRDALVYRLDALLGAGVAGPPRPTYDELLQDIADLRGWVQRLGRDAGEVAASRDLAINHVRHADAEVAALADRLDAAKIALTAATREIERIRSENEVLRASRAVRWAQRVRALRNRVRRGAQRT